MFVDCLIKFQKIKRETIRVEIRVRFNSFLGKYVRTTGSKELRLN